MPQTGLGVAIKTLRERRTLSLREIGQLSSVDHAYVHRLESGEKTNPSLDLVEKLLRVLKPGERDAAVLLSSCYKTPPSASTSFRLRRE